MFQSKIVISFLILFVFTIGIGLGFFLFKSLNNADFLNAHRTTNKRYLRDELLLSGKDKVGNSIFLRAEFSRKQTALGTYSHTYSFTTIAEKKVVQSTFEQETQSDKIIAGGIISKITITPAEDLSSRETYSLTASINGQEYEFKTTQFEGDFIVNNSINFTKYVSAGKATVTFLKSSYTVNSLLVKSYAENYSPLLQSSESIQSNNLSHFLTIWDASGTFYYIEQSHSPVQTLALEKTISNEMLKSKNVHIISTGKSKALPTSWSVSLPDVNSAKMDVIVDYYNDASKEGTVSGKVTDSKGTREIYGFATYGGD